MTPQSYIEDCVKSLRGKLCGDCRLDKEHEVKNCDASWFETHLTSSLNGLLELIEKEIEGRKLLRPKPDVAGTSWDWALTDLSTWLKSIK